MKSVRQNAHRRSPKQLPPPQQQRQRRARRNKETFQCLTDAALMRMCHRAGIKRVAAHIYNTLRYDIVRDHLLTPIMRDAVILATTAQRHTITLADMQLALRRHRHIIYGFGRR